MTQWIEQHNGVHHWCQRFAKHELVLLKKYHSVIKRLTKLDYTKAIGAGGSNGEVVVSRAPFEIRAQVF